MSRASDSQKQVIGTYEIERELGRGGMGVVFRAFEPALSRFVALKMLSENIAHQPALVARFYREARAMASISDPNVVQIHAVGEHAGQPYFVMEMIDGESLGARLKRERLSVAQACEFLRQAALGLLAAHERNLIHRDIKPANLMITKRGVVKVMDFGIALTEESQGERLTGTGGIVGTPGYLSPEVCLGQTPDMRTDIFALGVVFFEMLTGRLPFDDKSPYALMVAVVQAQIPDVTLLNSNIDPHTLSVLKKMLERDPNDRFQNCDALLAALDNKTRLQATPLPPTELITQPVPILHQLLPPALPAARTPIAAQPPMPPPRPQISAPEPRATPVAVPANTARNLMPWGIGLAACAVGGYFAVTNLTSSGDQSERRPGQIEQRGDDRDFRTSNRQVADNPGAQDPQIASAEPLEAAAATPNEPAVEPEQDAGAKSIYDGSNLPDPETSGTSAGAEITRELLGKYAAESKDDEKASFIIDSLGARVGDDASGYLLFNDERISLRGSVINLQSEKDDDGDVWRVYSVSMRNSDGAELAASLKHTDENIDGTLLYKSSPDADVASFDVVDYSPN
jgi:serine/threonine protein kinase